MAALSLSDNPSSSGSDGHNGSTAMDIERFAISATKIPMPLLDSSRDAIMENALVSSMSTYSDLSRTDSELAGAMMLAATPAASAVTRLPLEILDQITGLLKGDFASLRSCTLVAPLWTVAARRLLFQNVKFLLDDEFDQPDGAGKAGRSLRTDVKYHAQYQVSGYCAYRCIYPNTRTLLQFLDEEYLSNTNHPEPQEERPPYRLALSLFNEFLDSVPYVRKFVKRLELACTDPEDEVYDYQVDIVQLFNVLHKLEELDELVLDSVFWSKLPSRLPDSRFDALVCTSIKTLHALNLASSTEDVDQVSSIFKLLPSLTSIICVGWSMDYLDELDLSERLTVNIPKNLRTEKLVFSYALGHIFLPAFAKTESIHTLKTLVIGMYAL